MLHLLLQACQLCAAYLARSFSRVHTYISRQSEFMGLSQALPSS